MRSSRLSAPIALCLLLFASCAVAAQSTQCVTNALAGGTPNAITIPRLPCTPTTATLYLTTIGANTTSNVTLQVIGQTPPEPVVRANGSALQPGDFPAAGGVVHLVNNGSRWMMIANGPGAGGTGAGGINQLTNDVTTPAGNGSQPAIVRGIQGRPVSSAAPAPGQVLGWNGSAYVPLTPSGGSTTGFSGSITVVDACTGSGCTPSTSCQTYTNGVLSNFAAGSCSGSTAPMLGLYGGGSLGLYGGGSLGLY